MLPPPSKVMRGGNFFIRREYTVYHLILENTRKSIFFLKKTFVRFFHQTKAFSKTDKDFFHGAGLQFAGLFLISAVSTATVARQMERVTYRCSVGLAM